MAQRILIIGAGFAGMWSALGAARLLESEGKAGDVEVDGEIETHRGRQLHGGEVVTVITEAFETTVRVG